MEVNYASKGLAGTALGTGIGGLALGLLNGNGGNLLGNLLGGNCGCGENAPVNRYEMHMQQALAAKDAEIGLLKSNIYTDGKLVELYTSLDGKISALAGEVRGNKDAQNAVNMQQAVYNGTNTAAFGCLQNQVNELLSLTKRVVPNGSICPGWGDVTVSVTPAAATTAG